MVQGGMNTMELHWIKLGKPTDYRTPGAIARTGKPFAILTPDGVRTGRNATMAYPFNDDGSANSIYVEQVSCEDGNLPPDLTFKPITVDLNELMEGAPFSYAGLRAWLIEREKRMILDASTPRGSNEGLVP
jgi:hypothetical protein